MQYCKPLDTLVIGLGSMLADPLTKALTPKVFTEDTTHMGVVSLDGVKVQWESPTLKSPHLFEGNGYVRNNPKNQIRSLIFQSSWIKNHLWMTGPSVPKRELHNLLRAIKSGFEISITPIVYRYHEPLGIELG
ncbi:hypothetical protein M9H77_18167 [Catharanthus roseus]|uniref:Uncharacterized protein n=1 Tax=Catharanthus roseus TaxID=4058 RepID=A0ACC0B6P3_CATRO|nr:hypothetical protein M9H77_18167 [Catharanthus roseus]